MTLHSDIPTRAQIEQLLTHRAPASVSIYLPTSRTRQGTEHDRARLSALRSEALDQLRAVDTARADIEAIDTAIDALIEDIPFWARQADTLVVFAAPDILQTFRLPNHLTEVVEVADRFFTKPLLRSITFPQAAYVLALAKGSVRLLEVRPDGPPEEVVVPDMPRDAWDTSGNKVIIARDRNYVRQIDHALRGVLRGSDHPLILAATETIAALYRSVNSYPHLVAARCPGNPEVVSDAQLAADARTILDDLYAAELAELAKLFDLRRSQGRSATDISDVARLATLGAVDTVLVDMDVLIPGFVDDESGAVEFSDVNDANAYGIVDEIARRVYLNGGRVMSVRQPDLPGDTPVAAILRYVV